MLFAIRGRICHRFGTFQEAQARSNEVGTVTRDHRPGAEFIRDASRALLAAVSLREVLDAVHTLVRRHCDSIHWCEVILSGDGPMPDHDSPRASCGRACIPLRIEDVLLGYVALDWDGTARIPADWDDRVMGDLAQLAAVAISSRQRLTSLQERVQTEADEFKVDLIAMLSHEMRTPLASIKGYASSLLLDDIEWDEATRREFIEAIDEECDHLTEMVSDLLDSTVMEAGSLELRREPVLLVGLVRRLIAKMSKRSNRHRFLMSFSDGFPIVEADEHRIVQVLTNLIDNAVKYSPDGGLIVVSGELGEGDVIVRVADQGIGIAPEHLNKLFERFFRTKQPDHKSVAGTGLGLPIAEAIVRAHGGRIWAESRLGEGTTLSFTLPAELSQEGRT
jgi:signal transduction histidine kinase